MPHMDIEKIKIALGQPATAWIVTRLRRRLECGSALTGTIILNNPSVDERSAVDRLLGRAYSGGASLHVDLERLEQILRKAQICDHLTEVVVALHGPIHNLRAAADAQTQAWEKLFSDARQEVSERPELCMWIQELRDSGLLHRLCHGDLNVATDLFTSAIRIVQKLPAQGLPLAQLSAGATGNSHALDPGRPLGTLIIRAAAKIGGFESNGESAQDERDIWASVGVACDELGVTVLALNLSAAGDGLTDRMLNLLARSGEPFRLTLRQLLRHPPVFAATHERQDVFVCENRTVVTTAADRLGARCAPLICTDGQPSSAVRVLLSRLAAAGFILHYHGDFDWGGLRIGNLIMRRHSARPWRFNRDDYAAAAESGSLLKGSPCQADWDPSLSAIMIEREKAVHEEQVIEQLLDDLAKK